MLLNNEIWKDIPNYKGYQVSNLGRVRTYNKTTYTEKHGIRHWKNRIIQFKNKNENAYKTGYQVDLWKNNKPYRFLVARLVAFTFYNKNINDKKLTVDHLDGNRLNNNIENLEIVSLQENIKREFEKEQTSIQKNIIIINKKNNEKIKFLSMTKASLYINKNKGYISSKILKNIYENKEYRWELIN